MDAVGGSGFADDEIEIIDRAGVAAAGDAGERAEFSELPCVCIETITAARSCIPIHYAGGAVPHHDSLVINRIDGRSGEMARAAEWWNYGDILAIIVKAANVTADRLPGQIDVGAKPTGFAGALQGVKLGPS